MRLIQSSNIPGKIVWGVPEKTLAVKTDLPGRQRLRFRIKSFGKVFFKTPEQIRCFILTEVDGHWLPILEQGRNIKR
jgi:hypothetical protein